MTLHLRLFSSLLLLLSLAGCKNELTEPAACLQVTDGWVPSNPVYIMFFKEGVPAQEMTDQLAAKHELEIRDFYPALGGFAANVPTEAAYEALRCESVLRVMGWGGVTYAPHSSR